MYTPLSLHCNYNVIIITTTLTDALSPGVKYKRETKNKTQSRACLLSYITETQPHFSVKLLPLYSLYHMEIFGIYVGEISQNINIIYDNSPEYFSVISYCVLSNVVTCY